MKKFVSIVIPRYKETEKDIFPLLSSINGQVGVDLSDIEAIIANDGKNETNPLDGTFLSLFDFDIRQVTCEVNLWPRQAGGHRHSARRICHMLRRGRYPAQRRGLGSHDAGGGKERP